MENTSSVKQWWQALSGEKRRTIMFMGALALLLLVIWIFIKAGPEKKEAQVKETKGDTALLTGADARTLGMEQVGADLRALSRESALAQKQIQGLQEERVTKKDMESLKQQMAEMTKALDLVKTDGDKRTSEMKDYVDKSRATETPAEAASAFQSAVKDQASEPTNHQGLRAGASPRSAMQNPPTVMKIQVLGESPKPATDGINSTPGLYIPGGTILSGVLLTGVDAPAGMESKREPIPALMRVKMDAVLPNFFRSDLKECFITLGATGDLSTERAMMRTEVLSCVRKDGGVIEVALDGYANGDDAKAGIRGRLVSRNGSVIAKAAFASFAEALSQVFRPVAVQGFNTSPGNKTQFQAPDTSDAFEASAYAGFGGAMKRLSEYFIDMADEIVPFIEVDAARQIDVVLLHGVTLQVHST